MMTLSLQREFNDTEDRSRRGISFARPHAMCRYPRTRSCLNCRRRQLALYAFLNYDLCYCCFSIFQPT
jgi:hypothetical protein